MMQTRAERIEILQTIERQRPLTPDESNSLARALYLETLKRGRDASRGAHYAPWSNDEDLKILKAAKRRIPATEIAIMTGRTPWAIRTRLYALRKLCGVNVRAARKRARGRMEA